MDLAARIRQYGLNVVYQAPNPAVDIVFVHGLNGHPHRTWTSSKTDTFWPADLLPDVVSQTPVRILSYGYNANVTSFTDGASKDRILNHSETLAASLAANREVRVFTSCLLYSVFVFLLLLLLGLCVLYNRPHLIASSAFLDPLSTPHHLLRSSDDSICFICSYFS